ncbi:M28 family peptidase [Actinoplanes siamensis]|uniref:Peptidase M28 domain-containing protein n=1 Tax=Actinoplanes siamensis TaxID=1223317 RepID=A0A919NAH0_9ACTN|nr:M28 family peptidase [Actinoplanes siamensis]GIF07338.1 hypothetical protein Asi03nite_48760 [Actinoplanes siamensis]
MTSPPIQAGPLAGLDALLERVSGERMAATVTALAGKAFTGRRVGSPGGAAARAWLTELLTATGATVTQKGFTVGNVPQVYAPPTPLWQHDGQTVPLVFGRDIAVHLASADHARPLRAPLAVAGYGDPAGRWLLVAPGTSLFDAYGHADGAAGLLLARGVDADGWHYTMLAGPDPGPLPVLSMETGLHQRMTAAARRADHDELLTAAAPIRRTEVTATNLHARYRQASPDGLNLLLTAHYDGVGDHPGLRQPAAADNGSGVAVVCEAARLLAPVLPEGVGLQVALLAAGPVASDNRRYAAAGLAAVGIGAGMAGYHSPADTTDRVETATLTAIARLVVATAWLAATAPATLLSSIGDKR